MVENIFPDFLAEALSCSFFRHCPLAIMVAIDPPGQAPSTEMLAASERETLDAFTLDKRRREWLAGRVCAKLAVQGYCSAQNYKAVLLHEIIIGNTESGRPLIDPASPNRPHLECQLSISHSSSYAIALVADASCGVDIQEPRPTLLRVKEKFCSDSEEQLLNNAIGDTEAITNLTLLWTAKEALRKAFSHRFMPGFHKLTLMSTETGGKHCWRLHFSCEDSRPAVIAGWYRGYGIALCVTGERADA